MLDSIKSINIISAYSANNFKTERNLSEVKDLFENKLKEKNETEDLNSIKKSDRVEISDEALKLLNQTK